MLVVCWRYAGVSAGDIAGDMLAICWLFAGDMLAVSAASLLTALGFSAITNCEAVIGVSDSVGLSATEFFEFKGVDEKSEEGSSNKFQGRYAFFLKRFF